MEDPAHFRRREDRHVCFGFDLHLLDLLRGGELFGGQAVLRSCEGEKDLHADQHAVAGFGGMVQPA